MKNNEEFRRLVFEKAEAYEKRRRARNRKIAGSMISFALILALTLPISLHLYQLNAHPAEETTPAETMAFTTTAAETTSVETHFTTTEATPYTTTTPRVETTTEWTYPTTTIETTNPKPTTTVMTTPEATTTWVPDIPWTTTKLEPPSTTTAEEAEKPIHLLGEHQTTGFCYYDRFIEHYHGKHVLVKVITSENDLLTYLEEHTSLYGGKIMDVLNVYDMNFFRKHDLLIIESPHMIRDVTVKDDELFICLNEGMSNGSRLNLITMEKNGAYFIDSIWT